MLLGRKSGRPCLYRGSGFEVVDWIWLGLAKYQDGFDMAGKEDERPQLEERAGHGVKEIIKRCSGSVSRAVG